MTKDEFYSRWINNILTSINNHVDENTKIVLLESCGRYCARFGMINNALSCQGDVEKFLSVMRTWVGKNNVSRDGNKINVIYEKCYCQLKAPIPKELGETFCNCSRGWLKEMFETVLKKPVNVEIKSTIKCGADRCQFVVNL